MTEKHELLAELAQINMQIMEGKNALVALKEEEEAYLVAREEEAVKRVSDVLQASQEALVTASSHLKVLEKIRHGISGVVSELITFKERIDVSRETLKADEKRVYAEIDEKRKELAYFMQRAEIEQVKIDSAWNQIRFKDSELKKEAERVRDERLQLSAAVKHYGKRIT